MDSDSSKYEFSKIRGEFMSLMKEVNLDAQVEAARRDTKDELTHAYTELDRLHKKLKKEKENRKRIQSELMSIKISGRGGKGPGDDGGGDGGGGDGGGGGGSFRTNTSIDEIRRKTSELEAIQKEKDSISQWLERGKEELTRITNEEKESRVELEAAEAEYTELSDEKTRLTSELKKLSQDLLSVREDIDIIEDETEEVSSKLTEYNPKLVMFEKKNSEVESNLSEMKEECKNLTHKIQDIGDFEGSLVDMCNCMADLIDDVTELNSAILNDKLECMAPSLNRRIKQHRVGRFARSSLFSSSPSPGMREGSVMSTTYGDTEQHQEMFNALHGLEDPRVVGDNSTVHDGGNQGGPSIEDAKKLIQALHDGVMSLSDTVYRHIKEKQKNNNEVQRIQQDQLAEIQRDKERLIEQHEEEKEEMRVRTRELEREVAEVAAKTDMYTKIAFERRSEGLLRSSSLQTGEMLSAENSKSVEEVEKEVEKQWAETTHEEVTNLFICLDKSFQEAEELQQTICELKGQNRRFRSLASGRKIDWVKVNESRHRYQQLIIEVEMSKNYQKKLEAENAHLEKVLKLYQQRSAELPEEAAARRRGERKRKKIGKLAFDEWKRSLLGESCCASASPSFSPSHALYDGDDIMYD